MVEAIQHTLVQSIKLQRNMIESRERHMNKAGTEIWLAFLEVRLQNDLEILLYQQERLVAQINGL